MLGSCSVVGPRAIRGSTTIHAHSLIVAWLIAWADAHGKVACDMPEGCIFQQAPAESSKTFFGGIHPVERTRGSDSHRSDRQC